ncbi:cytochrome ubiquinol oxidase subunit I [Caminibacter pacificus]
MTNFWALITQPVAQVKFLHVVSAGYTLASIFVLGISSLYLLKGKHVEFAKKSATVAAAFGLISSIFVAVIGDEHAYEVANTQPTKIASAEGLYVGEKGAPIVAFGIPKNLKATEVTSNEEGFAFKIELPKMLSLLGKRNPNAFVPGLKDLVNGNEEYGIWPLSKLAAVGKEAKDDLLKYHEAKKAGDTAAMEAAKADFYKVIWEDPKNGIKLTKADLIGYGYFANPNIDPNLIYPPVPPVFYAFHIMVGLGFWFILLFLLAYVSILKGTFVQNKLVQRLAVISVPLPWIATSFGWMTAEIGRQPWTVFGVLPTAESVTPIALQNVQATFFMFLTAFVILGIAELKILFTVVKNGPKGAH